MYVLYVFMHVKCTTLLILLSFVTPLSVKNTNYEATHWAVLSSLLLHFAFILCTRVLVGKPEGRRPLGRSRHRRRCNIKTYLK